MIQVQRIKGQKGYNKYSSCSSCHISLSEDNDLMELKIGSNNTNYLCICFCKNCIEKLISDFNELKQTK